MALTDKLSDIANAIREKTGSDEPMTLADMPSAISEIPVGGGGMSEYTLPVANYDTLGGVKPVVKNSAMTQAVGVDADGRLYTNPSSGESSGGSSALDSIFASYTVTEDDVTNGKMTYVVPITGISRIPKMISFRIKTAANGAAINDIKAIFPATMATYQRALWILKMNTKNMAAYSTNTGVIIPMQLTYNDRTYFEAVYCNMTLNNSLVPVSNQGVYPGIYDNDIFAIVFTFTSVVKDMRMDVGVMY